VIFELPPLQNLSFQSQAKLMGKMEKRYDGLVWLKTHMTNIKNIDGLTFQSTSYVGHLCCENDTCGYLSHEHQTTIVNETKRDGCSPKPFEVGTTPLGSIIICKICCTI